MTSLLTYLRFETMNVPIAWLCIFKGLSIFQCTKFSTNM